MVDWLGGREMRICEIIRSYVCLFVDPKKGRKKMFVLLCVKKVRCVAEAEWRQLGQV